MSHLFRPTCHRRLASLAYDTTVRISSSELYFWYFHIQQCYPSFLWQRERCTEYITGRQNSRHRERPCLQRFLHISAQQSGLKWWSSISYIICPSNIFRANVRRQGHELNETGKLKDEQVSEHLYMKKFMWRTRDSQMRDRDQGQVHNPLSIKHECTRACIECMLHLRAWLSKNLRASIPPKFKLGHIHRQRKRECLLSLLSTTFCSPYHSISGTV